MAQTSPLHVSVPVSVPASASAPASDSVSVPVSASASVPVSVPVSVSKTDIPSTIRFHHERLDVYRLAIDFVVIADTIAENLNHGRGYLADQLRRAATSIPLNTAEGAGEFSRRDKIRFYRIARRSASECAAVIDICVRLQLVDDHQAARARDLLHRLISMLTRLTQR